VPFISTDDVVFDSYIGSTTYGQVFEPAQDVKRRVGIVVYTTNKDLRKLVTNTTT